LEATNTGTPSVKFSWTGYLLSKIHFDLLEDCKGYHRALEKGNKHVWSNAYDEAFHTLKKVLTTSLVLAQPVNAKSFNIYCDASSTRLGSVLMQEG
jgi:hypothetical protein